MADACSAASMRVAVTGASVARVGERWRTLHSFGQVLDELARHVAEISYHAPLAVDEGACDYELTAPNVVVHPWFAWGTSQGAMKHPLRLAAGYWRLVGDGDAVLVRGSGPLNWLVHLFARIRGRRVVHWIVGNPVAIISGADRGYGGLGRWLGIAFARTERALLRLSARFSRAALVVNGAELERIFRSPRTVSVVSTSIRVEDFRQRQDTCKGDEFRLLYMGFLRPEKGIEHLIRAIPLIRSPRPVRLILAGSAGPFAPYVEGLKSLGEQLGVADRVTWAGHVPFGPDRFTYMDDADALVLPTLSEGTPRVLVEARARCLPVVATSVGGIPSSVRHEEDGLLVPPSDPAALAGAIGRVLTDGDLRRRMIRAGYERTHAMTIDAFVAGVVSVLQDPTRSASFQAQTTAAA